MEKEGRDLYRPAHSRQHLAPESGLRNAVFMWAREETGVSHLEVKGSMADLWDFDLRRELARVEAFLESLGVKRIRK